MESLDVELEPKIALDPDMVGLSIDDDHIEVEHQYWRGPKFDDDLTSIAKGVSVYEASEVDRYFYGINRTEFFWAKEGGMKKFEVEEVRNTPSPIEQADTYCCRYVHSIVHSKDSLFHMDGAIRSYSEETMIARLDKDISKAGKNTIYKKLWRIDGDIDVTLWKSLLSDYFRDNTMIGEYLGGVDENQNGFSLQTEKSLMERLIPYALEVGAGTKIAMSFVQKHEFEQTETRWCVLPMDRVGDQNKKYVEDIAVELRKAMLHYKADLAIADEVLVSTFLDRYYNFPLVYINSKELEKDINILFNAIELLVNKLNRLQDNIITINLQYPIDDRDIRISVFGYVQDIYAWLQTDLVKLPLSREECKSWAERNTKYLEKTKFNTEKPHIFDILKWSGDLYIERSLIKEQYNLFQDDFGVKFSIERSALSNELFDAIQAKLIYPALCHVITESRCSKCGSLYRFCPHSRIIDDVSESIVTTDYAALFWTDRPLFT